MEGGLWTGIPIHRATVTRSSRGVHIAVTTARSPRTGPAGEHQRVHDVGQSLVRPATLGLPALSLQCHRLCGVIDRPQNVPVSGPQVLFGVSSCQLPSPSLAPLLPLGGRNCPPVDRLRSQGQGVFSVRVGLLVRAQPRRTVGAPAGRPISLFSGQLVALPDRLRRRVMLTRRLLALGSVTLLASEARSVVTAGSVSAALPAFTCGTRSGGAPRGERRVS